ncbi:hypothetical protein G9A89_004382 [Geosiphon pyriformis]|nr:hypothetical protein G9A89_004382 [Geosiphon pyriformis]
MDPDKIEIIKNFPVPTNLTKLKAFLGFTIKQDTTQTTLFELVYGRTETLPVKIEINTYLMESITEDNFQETLLKRTYNIIETLENK